LIFIISNLFTLTGIVFLYFMTCFYLVCYILVLYVHLMYAVLEDGLS